MTTPLYMLRAVQMGLDISDLALLEVGEILDMIIERGNDDYKWPQMATQADFDKFGE